MGLLSACEAQFDGRGHLDFEAKTPKGSCELSTDDRFVVHERIEFIAPPNSGIELAAVLGVIRVEAKIRKEERFPAWLSAAAFGLDSDEDRVDLGNGLGVVEFWDPAFLVRVILIEESQADGVLPVGSTAAPGLKDAGFLDAGLLVQIVAVKDERFVFGVEHAPEGLLGVTALADIVDFGDIELADASQVPDVAVEESPFSKVQLSISLLRERF